MNGYKKTKMLKYFFHILNFAIISCLGFGGGIALMRYIFLTVNNQGSLIEFFNSLKIGFFLGIVFSVFLILILFLLDISSRLFIVKDKNSNNSQSIWDIEQCREIELSGSLNEVLNIARQALMEITSIRKINQDNKTQSIEAVTNVTWRSFGEIITISVESKADNTWLLKCTSKCKNKNVLFDYAKNFENVETWLNEVNLLIKNKG